MNPKELHLAKSIEELEGRVTNTVVKVTRTGQLTRVVATFSKAKLKEEDEGEEEEAYLLYKEALAVTRSISTTNVKAKIRGKEVEVSQEMLEEKCKELRAKLKIRYGESNKVLELTSNRKRDSQKITTEHDDEDVISGGSGATNKKKSKSDHVETIVSSIDIKQMIQCSVCKSIPLGPILNCNTGHIICGKCRPKHPHCSCRAQFSGSRNFIAEKIVGSSRIPCEYREAGCNFISTGDELVKHVGECDFRPLTCLHGPHRCRLVVPYQDYIGHLSREHRAKNRANEGGKFTLRFKIEDIVKSYSRFCSTVVFQEKAFVIRSFCVDKIFHFGVCLVGSEMEALKYQVKMVFCKPGSEESFLETTLPVVPIRKTDGESLEAMYCILYRARLIQSSRVDTTPENKMNFTWTVKYHIFPV